MNVEDHDVNDVIHSYYVHILPPKTTPLPLSFLINSQELSIYLETIWSCFHASDEIGRLTLKRKLRELGNPTTTFLTPPVEKSKTKGRPSLKKIHSTHRDLSYFEIVEAAVSKKEADLSVASVTIKRQPKLTVKISTCMMHYLNSFPLYIQPYVTSILDVKADGHCGFRAIAGLLGYGEDSWVKVREDLVQELCSYRSFYVKFYGSVKLVADLLEILSYFTSPAPKKYWMGMPNMGHLVATKYNVPLVHISKQQCWTYLHLRSSPPPLLQYRVIAIGFVNDNHFVQVSLDHGAPLPPIVPNCKYFRFESAPGWDTLLSDRIEKFEALISLRNNSASVVIDLSDP